MIKYIALSLTALLGGLLYASSFPFADGRYFIAGSTIGFILLALALNNGIKKREFLFISMAFNLGFGALGFYWIAHTLKEFGGMTPPINQISAFLFYFLLAPQVYLFALFWFWAKKRNFTLGHHFAPLLFAMLYTWLEILTPQQFPAHLGHTFLDLKKHGFLNLVSSYGASLYSFLVAWIALELARSFSYRRFNLSILLAGMLIFVDQSNFNKLNEDNADEFSRNLKVRLVQPNIGNFLKLSSESGGMDAQREVYDTYYSLTRVEENEPIDLIVWPETAWPTGQNSDYMKKNLAVQPYFRTLLDKTNADLFFGGYDQNPEVIGSFENEYNSAFYFKNQSYFSDVYHKIKLIPFGETLPFGPFNSKLSELTKNVSFFAKGSKFTLFEMDNGHNFISAICYEILFSDFIREYLNSQSKPVHFLINLTNDSWYGETSEPWQHLFLARWRALEFNLPIIRATNTGISTVIFPNGQFSKYIGLNQKAILDIDLPLDKRTPTTYEKFGYRQLLILFFVLITFHFAFVLVIQKILNFMPKTKTRQQYYTEAAKNDDE